MRGSFFFIYMSLRSNGFCDYLKARDLAAINDPKSLTVSFINTLLLLNSIHLKRHNPLGGWNIKYVTLTHYFVQNYLYLSTQVKRFYKKNVASKPCKFPNALKCNAKNDERQICQDMDY